ncbi:guanine nucleotide exchange factor DBS isoform X2 [Nematostella vectensis]|uniref:guanine nucleotide exchange factor DBS isoform X2 n=1 Tax=Nematostella vectensis TaxID=45351 RepID=UPI002076E594|nr:guanine nucleotide exchange factor DBS isoform X2 [Nematostella vectensis]
MESGQEGNAARRINAFDIAALLQMKSVFLSGGKDKSGCLILTIPPGPASLTQLSDQDTEDLFRYLISLPRSEEKTDGFTFIIDKRKSKWSSLNNTLSKLQKTFPDRVNCVYVLKPQGFMQRFIGGSLSSEDAQAAFRIVVLGTVSDLLKYVTRDQLTTDLDGEFDYKHDEWVQHRTAIERLEKTIYQLQCRMDSHRQQLSKTEILSSIQDMEHTLDTQQEIWKDIKEDIASAHLTGTTLLRCISPDKNDENSNMTPDVKANTTELEGLLQRLYQSEEDFGKFWVDHEKRIRQGLELSFFEQEIGQVTGLILTATGHVTAMNDVGDSRAAAEVLLDDARKFAEKSQDHIERAFGLAARGIDMAENGHYSRDTIRLRSEELRQLCSDFTEHARKREHHLKVAMDIHEILEQVSKWCTRGVDLLASQPVEKFQSSDGAQNSLKEIENFLKDRQGISLKKLNKLEQMGKELGNKHLSCKVKDCLKRIGEVNQMMTKRENSLKRLVVKRPVQPVKALPANSNKEDEKNKINSSIQDEKKSKSPKPRRPVSIVVNRDETPSPQFTRNQHPLKSISVPDLLDVTDGVDTPEVIKKRSQIMAELVTTEKDYVRDLDHIVRGYLHEFERAAGKIPIELFDQRETIFGNIEEILEFHRCDFLEELNKCSETPKSVGKVFTERRGEFEKYALYCKNKPASEALQQQLINVPYIRECQAKLGHKLPLTAYLLKPVQRITKYQLLLREMMKNTKNDRIAYMNLMEAFHAMQNVLRHLNDVMHSSGLKGYHGNLGDLGKLLLQDPFLVWYTGARRKLPPLKGSQRQVFLYEKMVIFSKREEDSTTKDAVTYHFKNSIKTSDVGITETINGAPLKFELWLPGRTEVFLLQANNSEIKERWISEIRSVLLHQFDQVKDSAKWKSTPALNDDKALGISRPRAKSQSNLEGLSPAGLGTRYADIAEPGEEYYDDGDDFDTDEWSDDSDAEGSAAGQKISTALSPSGA